jgi:hypothetical protein
MFAQDACVPTKSHVQSNFQRMLKAILFTEKNGFFSFKQRKRISLFSLFYHTAKVGKIQRFPQQKSHPLYPSFSPKNQHNSHCKKKSDFSVYFSCKSLSFLLEYLCYVT